MVQGQLSIVLGAETVNCKLIRSDRARYLRLKINANAEVSVTVPHGVSQQNVIAFIQQQKDWIRRTLLELRRTKRANTGSANAFFTSSLPLRFFDADFKLQYEWKDVCWCAAKLDTEQHIITFTGNVLDCTLQHETFRDLLLRTATQHFPPMLDKLSALTGIDYKKCSVRLQHGRWGSCTSQGHISLNAQLLLFPAGLAEYVMIHELCHLRHMNHSAAFWHEVARYVPDYAIRRKTLQESARKLPDFLRHF